MRKAKNIFLLSLSVMGISVHAQDVTDAVWTELKPEQSATTLEFQVPASPDADYFTCRAGAAGAIQFRDFIASRNGNNMILHITLELDSLHIGKNQRLVFQPVLHHQGDSAFYERVVINSRVQQIRYDRGNRDGLLPTDRVYRRYNGKPQTIEYIAAVPYQSWMEYYNPALKAEDCGCGKIGSIDMASFRRFDLQLGPQTNMAWALAYVTPPAKPKIYDIEKVSYIDFPVDQITLYPEYRRNPAELDSIIRTINIVKDDPDITIQHITIHGWASPESPYDHNAYLAENRARTLKDYVAGMVKLPTDIWSVDFTPENWQGLRLYVDSTALPHRRQILALIDEDTDPDRREWLIKSQYPDDYKVMKEVCYPGLRRSTYHITYTVPNFTLDKAREIFKTKPQHLSLNELYMLANSYETGSEEFNEVMNAAVMLHPDDEYANLNAACAAVANGDIDRARRYAAKAGNSPEALNVKGLVAYADDDLDRARYLFNLAAAEGLSEAEINLATFGE